MYKGFVEFSLVDHCVNQCRYCPQDVLKANYIGTKTLSLEKYKLMVDKLPRSCISIAGFSEPFSNKDCIEMIDYVRNKHIVIVYTSLIGMTLEMYQRLRRMPHVRGLTVHVPDKEGNTKVNITEEYKEVLKYIVQNPPGPWCKFDFSLHGSQVHPDILSIVNIKPFFRIHDRAGTLQTDDCTVHKVHWQSGAIQCSNGFSAIESGIIMPNGNVHLCCMDFGLKYKLGNLLDQSWEEIMQSPIRKRMAEDRETGCHDDICRRCCEAQMKYTC